MLDISECGGLRPPWGNSAVFETGINPNINAAHREDRLRVSNAAWAAAGGLGRHVRPTGKWSRAMRNFALPNELPLLYLVILGIGSARSPKRLKFE